MKHFKIQKNQKKGSHYFDANQPPAPVKLLSRRHPMLFPVQAPARRRPRVGGFRGPAATCADPGKGIATQRVLRSELKTQNPRRTKNFK